MKTASMEKTMAQQLKYFFGQLSETPQTSVLQLIKSFVEDNEEKAERISSEEYNSEIEEVLKDGENGNVYSPGEVQKMAKEW